MAVSVMAIEIPELPELLKKLKTIGDKKLANKAFRKGLRTGAKRMAKEARHRAPIHDGPYPESRKDREPGTYQKSIKVRAIKRTRKGVGVRVADWRDKGSYYGAFGELGTKHEAAKPVLRPAFDRNKDATVDDVKQEIKTAVEGAFKK